MSAAAGCPAGTYTAPVTFTATNGSVCPVTVPTPQGGPDTRWVFKQWADGVLTNARTLAVAPGASYSLIMDPEHRLTRTASGAGTVSGADGFYPGGTIVQLTATPQAGYQFTGWSGSATGAANPLAITMNGPKTMTASFAAAPTGIRFESNAAAVISVGGGGCPAGAYATPVTLTWATGATCNIDVLAPAATVDSRWVFSRWADGPTSAARSIAASPGAVYSIVFAAEYRLTRSVSGPGSVSGSDGFYAVGATVQLTATPQTGQQFTGWSGAATGSGNPLNVTMDGAKTIVANFGATAVNVRIEANIATLFNVVGTGCPAGSYTAPATLAWSNGASCALTVVSPPGFGDTRYTFSRWTDGITANPRSIAASAGAVYTFTMAAEHRLTRTALAGGSVSGADGFYAAGSSVQLTATPQAGYQFAGWSGSAAGAANPLTVGIDGPKSIVANFSVSAATVRIDSNAATQVSVTGAGCPAGTHTTPVNLTWTYGAACSIAASSPQGGADTRIVFTRWTDGVTANPRTVVASPGAVYTLSFTTEHRLTRGVSGGGSVSGADGFYAAGSNVQLTATPSPGQSFAGWTGAASGAANPLTLRMDGPTTVTANFAAGVAVGTMAPLSGSGSNVNFTATYSHGAGPQEFYLAYILFLPTSNVVQYTAKGSCLVEYNRISHGMRLVNDQGTDWLGPLPGVPISPRAGILRNSQCTLNISAASASITGNAVTVTAPVIFHNGVSPLMATFLQAFDVKGNYTGMTQFGNWQYSGGTTRPGPAVVNVASSTSQGSSATYTFTGTHTSGVQAIASMHLLVSERILGAPPCHALYIPGNNTLNLVNDDSTGLVSSTGLSPGAAGTIANSRCSIDAGRASKYTYGNNLAVVFPMTFQPGTFGGAKNVYANVFDGVGLLSHWVQSATLIVQ